MKLINLFFLVVVLSLNHSYSQAQVPLSPILTPNNFANTNKSNLLFNEMFWRNLHPIGSKSPLDFKLNNTMPSTIGNNFLSQYTLDIKLNPTIQAASNYASSLTHFKQSIQNIAREVKQHSKPKKHLEFDEDLMKISLVDGDNGSSDKC